MIPGEAKLSRSTSRVAEEAKLSRSTSSVAEEAESRAGAVAEARAGAVVGVRAGASGSSSRLMGMRGPEMDVRRSGA